MRVKKFLGLILVAGNTYYIHEERVVIEVRLLAGKIPFYFSSFFTSSVFFYFSVCTSLRHWVRRFSCLVLKT